MPPASEALEPRCAWGGPCPLLNGNIPPELPLRLPADARGSSALVRLIPTGTGGGRPVLHHNPTPTRKDAFRPNAVRATGTSRATHSFVSPLKRLVPSRVLLRMVARNKARRVVVELERSAERKHHFDQLSHEGCRGNLDEYVGKDESDEETFALFYVDSGGKGRQ
ncbi:hypothetical protein HPB50_000165 [Hyalomma asiaticum]|uniref:Uncharacterized protein n=1 Tax=Hyalomma asiaticum TaxID=266040 RepID=A0ACB7TCI2_HYAAI|nr:hypothetical protein HPB50_000165 [Hyalomma asiaticum]